MQMGLDSKVCEGGVSDTTRMDSSTHSGGIINTIYSSLLFFEYIVHAMKSVIRENVPTTMGIVNSAAFDSTSRNIPHSVSIIGDATVQGAQNSGETHESLAQL